MVLEVAFYLIIIFPHKSGLAPAFVTTDGAG